jgi:hypothetical protein
VNAIFDEFKLRHSQQLTLMGHLAAIAKQEPNQPNGGCEANAGAAGDWHNYLRKKHARASHT